MCNKRLRLVNPILHIQRGGFKSPIKPGRRARQNRRPSLRAGGQSKLVCSTCVALLSRMLAGLRLFVLHRDRSKQSLYGKGSHLLAPEKAGISLRGVLRLQSW